jgi:dTDP-4-amino-4,6-dideoxygalactose transaminase
MVADETELSLANLFGVREAILVGEDASANLVAITSLTSPLMGKLRLKPRDEVITVAAGSRSLVAAILQNKLVPKFVDLALPGFNVDVQKLQGALSSRVRAIALPHLCGNPYDLDAVTMFAAFNNLLLVEDCREAAGASFGGRPVGCFGQFATASFADGNEAVLMSSSLYRTIAESLCERVQPLDTRLSPGIEARALLGRMADLTEHLILPETLRTARPSWRELPIVLRNTSPFTRDELIAKLSDRGVAARPFVTETTPLPVTSLLATHGLLASYLEAPRKPAS